MAESSPTPQECFEKVVLPHLDAAYNLARWLTKDEHDASDMVQEACLRALKYMKGRKGENDRAWFLSIVRNTCCTWLRAKHTEEFLPLNETLLQSAHEKDNPEKIVLQRMEVQMLRAAIEELPVEFREVIILRELEELSYDEIGKIAGIPMGTVMSRLARARARLQDRILNPKIGASHGMQ